MTRQVRVTAEDPKTTTPEPQLRWVGGPLPPTSLSLTSVLLRVIAAMTTFDSLPGLQHQVIELPSWAFGNSGTRFKVFGTPGTPRTIQEKLADAAKVTS